MSFKETVEELRGRYEKAKLEASNNIQIEDNLLNKVLKGIEDTVEGNRLKRQSEHKSSRTNQSHYSPLPPQPEELEMRNLWARGETNSIVEGLIIVVTSKLALNFSGDGNYNYAPPGESEFVYNVEIISGYIKVSYRWDDRDCMLPLIKELVKLHAN